MFSLTIQANRQEIEEVFSIGDPLEQMGTLKLLGVTNILLQLNRSTIQDIRSALPDLGIMPRKRDIHYLVPKELNLLADPLAVSYTEEEKQSFAEREEQRLDSIAGYMLKPLQGLPLEKEIDLLRSAIEVWLVPVKPKNSWEKRKTPLERFQAWADGVSIAEQEILLNYPVYQAEDIANFARQQRGEQILQYAKPINNPQLHKDFLLHKVMETRRDQITVRFGPTSILEEKIYKQRNSGKRKPGFHSRPIPSEFFSALDSIIPLAWAEIYYCIRQEFHASICPICGKAFSLIRLNPGTQQIYCSVICGKEASRRQLEEKRRLARLTPGDSH